MRRPRYRSTAAVLLLTTLFCAGVVAQAVLPDIELIASRSEWRYLDDRSDQGTAWRELDFDDSTWKTGRGVFGFGEAGLASILESGTATDRILTYYFRSEFQFAGEVGDMVLRMIRDDGAVVYLNGVELRRDNLPLGEIDALTTATVATGVQDETRYFESIHEVDDIIRPGRNVVCVELHRRSSTDFDCRFDLEATLELSRFASEDSIAPVPGVAGFEDAILGQTEGNSEEGRVGYNGFSPSGLAGVSDAKVLPGGPEGARVFAIAGDDGAPPKPAYLSFDRVDLRNHANVSVAMALGSDSESFLPGDVLSVRATFLTETGEVLSEAELLKLESGVEVITTPVLEGTETHRVLVPFDDTADVASPNWRETGFDDSKWISGPGGVGYERSSGYQSFIGLDVNEVMYNLSASTYIRVPFILGSLSEVESMELRMQYDDGFVAWINGVEVARANAPVVLDHSSEATASHSDALSVVPVDFEIEDFNSLLHEGENLLAIHGMNRGITSSDFLIRSAIVGERVAITTGLPTLNRLRNWRDFQFQDVAPAGTAFMDLAIELVAPRSHGLIGIDDVRISATRIDDGIGQVSVFPVLAGEPEFGQRPVKIPVFLAEATPRAVEVAFRTRAISAAPGNDYQQVEGVLEFAPGETRKEIEVPIFQDGEAEDDELFVLLLEGRSNAIVGAPATLVTITEVPFIGKFEAQPESVGIGDEVQLVWESQGGDEIRISPGFEGLADSGALVVRPTEDIRYELSVSSARGGDQRSVFVEVAGVSLTPIPGALGFATGSLGRRMLLAESESESVAFRGEAGNPLIARVYGVGPELQVGVRLAGPDDETLASDIGVVPGAGVVLVVPDLQASGPLRLELSSPEALNGELFWDLVQGALAERELIDRTANGVQALAEPIILRAANVGASVVRNAVLYGALDGGGTDLQDWFRLTLDPGERLAIQLTGLGVDGTERGALNLRLHDASGAVLAESVAASDSRAFIESFQGGGDPLELWLGVSGTFAGAYTLTAVTEAEVELEGDVNQTLLRGRLSLGAVGAIDPRIDPPKIEVALIGDYGWPAPPLAAVSEMIAGWNPDAIVTLGDNTYGNADLGSTDWTFYIGAYFGRYMMAREDGRYPEQTSPLQRFFPAVGNHDSSTGSTGSASGGPLDGYLDYFHDNPNGGGRLPYNGSNALFESYFHVRLGDAHFFVLDSDHFGTSLNQILWLRGALANSDAKWKFVVLHHPPYTSITGIADNLRMQLPYGEWGADAVFAGHAHIYAHLLIDGLHYWTCGVGGRSLHQLAEVPREGSLARQDDSYGALRVGFDGDRATVEFWGVDVDTREETLMDTTTLVKPDGGSDLDREDRWQVPVRAGERLRLVSIPVSAPQAVNRGLTETSMELRGPLGTLALAHVSAERVTALNFHALEDDGYTAIIRNDGGTGGTYALSLEPLGDERYEAWRTRNFGAENSPATAPQGDFNADGLSNLQAFAFGLDPRANQKEVIAGLVTVADGMIRFSIPRSGSALGARVYVEESGDAIHWTPGGVELSLLENGDDYELSGSVGVEDFPRRRYFRVRTELDVE